MASHELKVRNRAESGKSAARKLRRAGLVPAIAYGQKEEPIKLAVDARELRDLVAHGAHGLVTLKFENGDGADTSVIIKELQRHPVKHTINAVDFLRVSLDEEVTSTVPIVLEGEPIGVKMDGGVLVQALHEIEVSALPQNLPEQIAVDVSHLEMNGAPLHVRELSLPEGVKIITDGDETVAVVNAPRVEEVAAVTPTEEAAGEPTAAEEADTEEG